MNRRLEVVLTPWQRQRLVTIRDHPPSPKQGRRAVCLLMSVQGLCNKDISQATGFSSDTITFLRRRWRQDGLGCLQDRPRCGRPPKVTADYRQQLRKALLAGPQAYGYVFTVWSIGRLQAHLHKATGVSLSDEWLRGLVHAQGFVYRRPKHTLRGRRDEDAFRKARRALHRLKKGLWSPTPVTSCGIRTSRNSTCTRT